MYSPFRFLLFIGISLSLCSCEFSCSVGSTKEENNKTGTGPAVKEDPKEGISNDITLSAAKIEVKKAYLRYADGSGLVPAGNRTQVDKKIQLVLELADGWVIKDNKASVGASEKISTSKGDDVVTASDLFEAYTATGIDPTDAKTITLGAVISKHNSNIDHYLVEFRVWDKYGEGEINGNYKFYIK